MKVTEILKMALESISANKLRSVLTLLIIAFGLMALVGILTALDSLLYSLNDSFSDLGSNSFTIERKNVSLGGGGPGRRRKQGVAIDYDQAAEFKERFSFPSKVSISINATSGAVVAFGEKKTNPNIPVTGIDENYLSVKGKDLAIGRNFSDGEINSGAPRAIIGSDLIKSLFEDDVAKALNADILVGNQRYTVIGILQKKGSGGGSQSGDKTVLIPLLNSKRVYDTKGSDYTVIVGLQNAAELDYAGDVALGLFRQVRKLPIGKEDDFEIFKSNSILEILKTNTVYIRTATIAIGLITLLGASIGLMNIMLVSVTERTREIGIRKSLGATPRAIMLQFLLEAIIICQMGGFVGIFFGVMAGVGVSAAAGGSFVMPWLWISLGVFLCLLVGLSAGYYPAKKAASLDPIESLRYE